MLFWLFYLVTGAFFGSWVAAQLSSGFLKGFFVVFLYYVATQMLLDIRPSRIGPPLGAHLTHSLPVVRLKKVFAIFVLIWEQGC